MKKQYRRDTRGSFGIGVYRPKGAVNIGTLWRSAQCLGANFIFTIQERFPEHKRQHLLSSDPYLRQSSDSMGAIKHVPYMTFPDVQALRSTMPLHELVAVEQAVRSEPLDGFIHPPRAIYLLGAEDIGIPRVALAQCDHVVEIQSWRCLNVAAAGTVVLYDRGAKGK